MSRRSVAKDRGGLRAVAEGVGRGMEGGLMGKRKTWGFIRECRRVASRDLFAWAKSFGRESPSRLSRSDNTKRPRSRAHARSHPSIWRGRVSEYPRILGRGSERVSCASSFRILPCGSPIRRYARRVLASFGDRARFKEAPWKGPEVHESSADRQ